MTRSTSLAILFVAMVSGSSPSAAVRTLDVSLAGRWTLNRGASQFPDEIGFAAAWLPAGGGPERRGLSGAAPGSSIARPESEDDARRVQQLTAEVRNPSPHLTIADTSGAVTIAGDRGHSRTFHPDGREEVIQLDDVPVAVVAKRDAGRLIILYKVAEGRQLRYTYTRAASAPQLVVDVQFIERGQGDAVRRIYEPAGPNDTAPAAPAASTATAKSGEGSSAARPLEPGRAGAIGRRPPAEVFNQQPDAELKRLTRLGVVVEALTAQAAACGLSQGSLETAVSKRLSDAGFKVLPDSDEDSYVYVNVMTSSLSSTLCVSRYDVFLYTHTTATLSYQDTPVLVQVSLLHKGGITGGAPAAHAEGVLRGVQEYVDQFITRIRDANK